MDHFDAVLGKKLVCATITLRQPGLQFSFFEQLFSTASRGTPRLGNLGLDVENQSQIGSACPFVERLEPRESRFSDIGGQRLVEQAREVVAVGHHDLAAIECGQDLSLQMIHSIGGEEESEALPIQLGRLPLLIPEPMRQSLSQEEPDRPLARFAGEMSRAPLCFQPVDEESGLSRRTRAIDSFQHEEASRPIHLTPPS